MISVLSSHSQRAQMPVCSWRSEWHFRADIRFVCLGVDPINTRARRIDHDGEAASSNHAPANPTGLRVQPWRCSLLHFCRDPRNSTRADSVEHQSTAEFKEHAYISRY
jgi:hypothetical protein